MIKNNQKFFAFYSVWVAVHVYLYLSGGSPSEYLNEASYQDREKYFQFLVDSKKYFYPFPCDSFPDEKYEYFLLKYYDYTELFVYSVAPLLLLFLYKAFIAKK